MSGTESAATDLLHRVRGEYMEMPGLSLTIDQAGRLWALETETCACLLSTLVEAGFLAQRSDGAYIRRGSGRVVSARFVGQG